MILHSLYGDRTAVPATGVNEFRVAKAQRPSTPHVYAEIVGGHEERLNLEPRVRLADGTDFYHEGVRVFHSNPAIREDATARVTQFGRGSLIDITDAKDGIQLGGGSKILDGGPVDFVALVGDVNGLPVVSDTVLCGLYSSDIVLGPIFALSFPDGSTVPGPGIPSTGTDTILARAQEIIRAAEVIVSLAK